MIVYHAVSQLGEFAGRGTRGSTCGVQVWSFAGVFAFNEGYLCVTGTFMIFLVLSCIAIFLT